DTRQCVLLIPSVIEEANVAVGLPALDRRDFQPMANCRFAHRLVSSQSDENIKRLCYLSDLAMQCLKEHAHRRRSRRVRHNEKDALIAIIFGRTSLSDQFSDFTLRETPT